MRNFLRRHVNRHDDFIFALAREGFEHFIPFHHG
jgi:hypothetical protein